MKIRLLLTVVLAVVGNLSAESWTRGIHIMMWRGETIALRVPDQMEWGEEMPKGISIRQGVLKAIPYTKTVKGREMGLALDKVEWSGKDASFRIVEVSVPTNARPGWYNSGPMFGVKVSSRVLPPPSERKYFLDLWQHPWAVARWNKVKPFSKEHYAAMRPLWETLAAAGQKVLTTTIKKSPWGHQCRDRYDSMVRVIRKADGSWAYDYSLFDEYVEFGRSCGIGPDIVCYTVGHMLRWDNEDGTVGEKWASWTDPKTATLLTDYWRSFFIAFSRHLKDKGWFDDTYIGIDEWGVEAVNKWVKFVRESAPGMKFAMAGDRHPSDFDVQIDNYCIVEGGRLDDKYRTEAAVRRTQGLKTTYYVCTYPKYPNTFMSSHQYEGFWCGVYPAMGGLDGFLRWAYNSWPADPEQNASFGEWPAGDTFLVYPDGSPSLRFLELRNGVIAAEKLRILRESGELPEAEFKSVADLFDPHKAREGKCDWTDVRNKTIQLLDKYNEPKKCAVRR